MIKIDEVKIAVIGLGYVGLPLAVNFSKKYPTVGFDVDENRITELLEGKDVTLEFNSDELTEIKSLLFSNNIDEIQDCNVYIITVPTPVDEFKRPDLGPLINASKAIAGILKFDDVVIYESTVYPGATEEDCLPVLENISGLTVNKDFYIGYSPERINPGDKNHRLTDIIKVTSGSSPEAASLINDLYKSIIKAGTYKASSIRVAEAAKVIENTQRDLNIALVNELAIIFSRLNIDTREVLDAAASKWNFLPFKPGLVGGHCIGVDPYYLTHKCNEIGYHPEIILAGRRINDEMPYFVANQIIHSMLRKKIHLQNANVLFLGMTFKENCPDTRNSKVVELINIFKSYECNIEVFDPWIEISEFKKYKGINKINKPKNNNYDVVIMAVPHMQFSELSDEDIISFCKETYVIYDIPGALNHKIIDKRL